MTMNERIHVGVEMMVHTASSGPHLTGCSRPATPAAEPGVMSLEEAR